MTNKKIEEQEDLTLNELSGTTWEGNFTDLGIPPRTLRIYLSFMRYFNIALIAVSVCLIAVIFFLAIKFNFFHQHEMFVFTDGTDITCLFDPKSGAMTQNDK